MLWAQIDKRQHDDRGRPAASAGTLSVLAEAGPRMRGRTAPDPRGTRSLIHSVVRGPSRAPCRSRWPARSGVPGFSATARRRPVFRRRSNTAAGVSPVKGALPVAISNRMTPSAKDRCVHRAPCQAPARETCSQRCRQSSRRSRGLSRVASRLPASHIDAGVKNFASPKSRILTRSCSGNHDVAGLQVAVQNTCRVRNARAWAIWKRRRALSEAQGDSVAQDLAQAPTMDELHGHEDQPVSFLDRVEVDDIGMVEGGGGFGFSSKQLRQSMRPRPPGEES